MITVPHIPSSRLSWPAWLVLALCLQAGVASGQSATVEPGAWMRFNGWEVRGFEVSGLPGELATEAVAGLESRGQWKLLRGRVRPAFHAKTLDDDLRRIRLFLARRGYPASRVKTRFETDAPARSLKLEIVVSPGTPMVLRARRYVGWPAGVTPPDSTDAHLPPLGQPLVDEDVDAMVRFLRIWLQDAGYATVKVALGLEAVGLGLIDLRLDITPGDFTTITSVRVTGCAEDLVPVARRVMDIDEGVDYGATMLAEGASDLRATQLFGHVELATEPVGPGELDLTARLTDARMRSWRMSVGTWTDNPWVVRAGWTHRNLFRKGRGFNAHGTYASHDRSLGAEVFWLGWLSPRARSSLGSQWMLEDEDAYLSREYALKFVQSFRPRGHAMMNVGIGISHVKVETYSPDVDDIPDEQDWLLETWFDRKWDWTDNMLYPTRGGYLKTAVTVAPPSPVWGSSYLKLQLDGTAYHALGSRLVVTARGRYGWSRPLGDNIDLLANRRFYAGGYNSMRGYARRKLGPRDSANNPRGGQSVALGGAEVRSHLFWILDGAAFIDAGQVWEHLSDASLADVGVAVGVGLDVRTPLGPLRVGHAWNLTEMRWSEPSTLWHFGIGYPW